MVLRNKKKKSGQMKVSWDQSTVDNYPQDKCSQVMIPPH